MFLNIVMFAALFTVLMSLVLGMINLRKQGEAARIRSNKLMRMRVVAQAVAIVVLFISIYLKSKAGG